MSAVLLTLTPSQAASNDLTEESFTPGELAEVLTQPQVGEKDGYALIPALFRPCPARCWRIGHKANCGGGKSHRLKANVTALTCFAADIDDVTEATMAALVEGIRAQGVEFYVWETFSHDPAAVANGEAKGRYRLLIPFYEPLPIKNPEQWSKGAWPQLVRRFGLGGKIDESCKDPSRLYYLPRMPEGQTREGVHFEGAPFDVRKEIGDLYRMVPGERLPEPMDVGEAEDPSRPVDLEELKRRLADTRNLTVKAIAEKAIRGELVTALPQDRKEGDKSRHEAWWLLTGRLSIVAEDWMSTEALLEVLRPSHTKERELSPDDFTPWDDDRDSVVEMLLAQRATAPTRRAQYKAERDAKNAVSRNAIDRLLKLRGRPGLTEPAGDEPLEPSNDDEEGPALEATTAEPWTLEELKANLRVKHLATGETVYPGTARNVGLVLAMAPDWRGGLRFNALRKQHEFWPCEALGITEAQPFSNTRLTTLRFLLESNAEFPMQSSREDVRDAAEWAAEHNEYEPVQEYLSPLQWDGTPRLATWLEVYLRARTTTEDGIDLRPYLAAIGKRWMISGAARAFDPGCKADCMLQIEGLQGEKKSSALEVLGGQWFTEATFDFQSRDAAQIIGTSWIVELGERASFDKASEAVQKAFLSRRVDTIVPKYSNYRQDLRRRCIFAGTTNQDEYLTDSTGNRRHWVFAVDGRADLDALKRDRDQLWAEATHLYRAGEQWHLTDDEKTLADAEAAKRVRTEMIDDMIESWFRRLPLNKRPKGVLPADIARKALNDDRGVTPKGRITAALKRLGFLHRAQWVDGKTVKRWATPAALLDAPVEDTRAETLEKLATAKKVEATA